MSDPKLIGPVLSSTPAEPGKPAGRVRTLPYDLLKAAANRLGIMSFLGATLWVIATVTDELVIRAISDGDGIFVQSPATYAIAGGSVLVSLAVFFYTRRENRDPKFILDLGL